MEGITETLELVISSNCAKLPILYKANGRLIVFGE